MTPFTFTRRRTNFGFHLAVLFVTAALLILLMPASTMALTTVFEPDDDDETEPTEIHLENEYIAIIVNSGPTNTGRFAVETTGGDPDRISDDYSPLIYKIPGQSPWTSYTTLRINGIDYVFGGEPTERAGRAGLFGEKISGPLLIDDTFIETVYQIGPIIATQRLSIIRSTTTGLLDTARIAYELYHSGTDPVDVGIRLMIDTMLGQNDGAPFRVQEHAITGDTMFERGEIPEFWQAFDSLVDPRVTSQGTLDGPDITPPDRVYFSNWGALADGLWDFNFEPGRDFTRLGEFELDSATAMYWDPVRFMPGERQEYVIHYGLGDISISPGQLSLGVTSPASVTAEPDVEVTFPVVAYVQNTGEGEARNVEASLILPTGLKPAEGETLSRSLGTLPSGRTAQVTWRVALDRAVGGELTYTARVEAINAEPNEVQRRVGIVAPAQLAIELDKPNGRLIISDNGSWEPLPYKIEARIENVGGSAADGVILHWESPVGLELATGDRATKPIGPLNPGESVLVSWHMRPVTVSDVQQYPFIGNLTYTVKGSISGRSDEYRADGFLDIPPLTSEIHIGPVSDLPVAVGDYFTVELTARNIRRFYGGEIVVRYDPRALHLVGGPLGVQRGRLFIDVDPKGEADAVYLPWDMPDHRIAPEGDAALIRIKGERRGARHPMLFWGNDTFATLHFRALQAGRHQLIVAPEEVRLYDGDNQGVRVQQVTGEAITVREQ